MANEKIDNPWLSAYAMERLEAYLRGEFPLHALVADLESAASRLRDVDESWMTEFQRLWTELEIINAVRLSHEDGGENHAEHEGPARLFVSQLLEHFSRLDRPR